MIKNTNSTGRGAQQAPGQSKQPGFWKELWLVLKEDIPGTKRNPGKSEFRWGTLAGFVIPVTMAVFAFQKNQFGFEAMIWLSGLYVALASLFGVHALNPSQAMSRRMQRVMPPVIVCGGVTAAALSLFAAILKASQVI